MTGRLQGSISAMISNGSCARLFPYRDGMARTMWPAHGVVRGGLFSPPRQRMCLVCRSASTTRIGSPSALRLIAPIQSPRMGSNRLCHGANTQLALPCRTGSRDHHVIFGINTLPPALRCSQHRSAPAVHRFSYPLSRRLRLYRPR